MFQPDATVRIDSDDWNSRHLLSSHKTVTYAAVQRGILRALQRYEERQKRATPYISSSDAVSFRCRWDKKPRKHWDNRRRRWVSEALTPPHRELFVFIHGWDVEFAVVPRIEAGLVTLSLAVSKCHSHDMPTAASTAVRKKRVRRKKKKTKKPKAEPPQQQQTQRKQRRGLELD